MSASPMAVFASALSAQPRPRLTDRQRDVLDFISECRRRGDNAPTRAEIAAHFGWASANAAEDHLRALQRKGYVEIHSGRSRGVFLCPKA